MIQLAQCQWHRHWIELRRMESCRGVRSCPRDLSVAGRVARHLRPRGRRWHRVPQGHLARRQAQIVPLTGLDLDETHHHAILFLISLSQERPNRYPHMPIIWFWPAATGRWESRCFTSDLVSDPSWVGGCQLGHRCGIATGPRTYLERCSVRTSSFRPIEDRLSSMGKATSADRLAAVEGRTGFVGTCSSVESTRGGSPGGSIASGWGVLSGRSRSDGASARWGDPAVDRLGPVAPSRRVGASGCRLTGLSLSIPTSNVPTSCLN